MSLQGVDDHISPRLLFFRFVFLLSFLTDLPTIYTNTLDRLCVFPLSLLPLLCPVSIKFSKPSFLFLS